MSRIIGVWLAVTLFQCIWPWAAGCDVSVFLIVRVPWEIHDYGLQRKIVSPLIKEFFYKRGFAERATSAITLEEVATAVLEQLDAASKPNVVPAAVISMAE